MPATNSTTGMPSHALDQRLFEQTAGLINENDSVSLSAPEGVSLINGWLKVIEGNNSTEIIAGKLIDLRDQLLLDTPDPDLIRSLLLTVADHTAQIAQGSDTQEQTAGKLDNLAITLRTLADL